MNDQESQDHSNENNEYIFYQNTTLSASQEYDALHKLYYSRRKVDRSLWLPRFLNSNPIITEFRNTVNPMARAIKFGKSFLPSDRLLNQQTLLSLISQHFHFIGLYKSQDSLYSECTFDFNTPTHFLQSQLTLIIQRGILNVEKFWEPNNAHLAQNEQERKDNLDHLISTVIGGAPTI